MGIKHSVPRLLALFFSAQASFALAQSAPQQSVWDCSGPWHMWSGGWGWWWIFPLFFMLMMIGVCAAAIYFIGHRSGSGHHFGPWHMASGRPWGDSTHSALQVLNERFARGEIQKQEYEEKKATILSGALALSVRTHQRSGCQVT